MSTATGVGVTIYTRRDDTRGERGLGFYKGRRPKQVRRYHTPSGLIGLRACWLVCGRLQGKLLVGWVLHLVAAVRTLRLVGFPCLQEGLFGLIYFCVCTMKPNCVVFVSGGAVVGTLRERLSREGPSANGRGEGYSVLFARLDLLVGWCRHELITELPSDQTIARVPSVLRGHQQRLFPDPRRSRSSFFFFFFAACAWRGRSSSPVSEAEHSKRRRSQLAERISNKLHALLWIIVGIAVAYRTDFIRVLLEDDRVNR